MRHRRRIHTQTIRRKSDTFKNTGFPFPKKKRSKKPLIIGLSIALIALVVYFYGENIQKIVSSNFDKGIASINQPVEKEKEPSIPVENNKSKEQYYSPIEKKIQLEILNGCGEQGVAKKLTDLLKKSTYDIVNSGNYIEKGKVNWDVEETKIIDQVGKVENSRELADLMGILYTNLEVFNNPSPIADITIIIGKDYKTLPIFQ